MNDISAIENIVEESLETMEKTVDILEKGTCTLTRKQHIIQFAIIGALAGGAGAALAYTIAKKQLKTKYESIAEQEIAAAKEFYSTLNKAGDLATPEGAVKKLRSVDEAAAALLTYQGEIEEGKKDLEEEESVVVEIETKNVFVESKVDDEFDLEAEVNSRTPDKPYVISQDEFLEGEPNFEQTTITYYAGDGTLADERDQEIPFAEPVVGEENLQRFGHGSGDARTVYIRNERLSTDFEVVKSDGKFAHEVLGFEHSDDPREHRRNKARKFRGGDE